MHRFKIFRLRKFLKKGWHVSTKTVVHIVIDILSAFEKDSGVLKQDEINSLIEDDEFDYENNGYQVEVDRLIQQLNGVDPLTIQAELQAFTGKSLSLSEVLELL